LRRSGFFYEAEQCWNVSGVITEILESFNFKTFIVHLGSAVFNQKTTICFMLEYWYKEKRTLVDFRRGPLGPHFDAFAARLRAEDYSPDGAKTILSKCCQFNAYLIEHGVATCAQLTESLIEPFLELYLVHTRSAGTYYSPKIVARGALKRLFRYLVEIKAVMPPKPTLVRKPHDWLLHIYLQHLQDECGFSAVTLQRVRAQVGSFLDALGRAAARHRFKTLRAEAVESYLSRHLKDSPENLASLGGSLRRFFRYCAVHQYTRMDFSGLIPPVRRYRHAALPKGMEDSALERVLGAIDRDTPNGARDYAIMVLMMAYGLRGVSVAQLLLDDIDWQRSRIRIRAQKGGKEVVLPLMDAVGDALIHYLRHRCNQSPFREVFLTVKAPVRPLNSLVISHLVRGYMRATGMAQAGTGTRTLRHSWAIRALANDSPIKAIADMLGHRYIDTTFIYAKADLKTLREVAMPWPEKG
jgi:site-specific recombinase XerD